jgi:hypothetical protein
MKLTLKQEPQPNKKKARFTEQATRARDFKPIQDTLVKIIRDDIDRTFKSSPMVTTGGKVQSGEKWDRLTDYTLALHPHRSRGRVLIDTGELWRSTQVDGSGNRYSVDKTEMTYELTSKKARTVQGKRPIVVMHDKLSKRIAAAQLAWVVKGKTEVDLDG